MGHGRPSPGRPPDRPRRCARADRAAGRPGTAGDGDPAARHGDRAGAPAGDAPAVVGPERARRAHARRGARVDAPGAARRARAVARRHPPERAGHPLPAQPEPARIRRVAGHRSAAGRERLPRRRPAQRAHRRGGQLRPDPAGGRRGVRGDPGPIRALRSQHARGGGEHHHPSGPGALRAGAGDLGWQLRPPELPAAAGRHGAAARLLRVARLHGRRRLAGRIAGAHRPRLRQGGSRDRPARRHPLLPVQQ